MTLLSASLTHTHTHARTHAHTHTFHSFQGSIFILGDVKGRFRLERVGQYLKDEPLSFPTPEKNSIWGVFLDHLVSTQIDRFRLHTAATVTKCRIMQCFRSSTTVFLLPSGFGGGIARRRISSHFPLLRFSFHRDFERASSRFLPQRSHGSRGQNRFPVFFVRRRRFVFLTGSFDEFYRKCTH